MTIADKNQHPEYDNDVIPTRREPEPEKPNTLRKLAEIFQNHLDNHHSMPSGFVYSPVSAARRWVDMQGAPTKSERSELRMRSGGHNGKYWHTPYLDRLVRNLEHFLILNKTDQQFIVESIERFGIKWRGEPVHEYRHLVELTTRNQK